MYIRKSLSKFQQTEPFSNTSELELKLFHFLTDNYDCFKCREELLKCGECDYCNDNFPIAIEDFKPQSQSARETTCTDGITRLQRDSNEFRNPLCCPDNPYKTSFKTANHYSDALVHISNKN